MSPKSVVWKRLIEIQIWRVFLRGGKNVPYASGVKDFGVVLEWFIVQKPMNNEW